LTSGTLKGKTVMRPPECNPIEENTELRSANKTKPVECGKVEHNYKKKKGAISRAANSHAFRLTVGLSKALVLR